MRLSRALGIPLVLAAVGGFFALSSAAPQPGGRSIAQEKVKVRLVTLDVVVFDQEDRTVPGLLAEDFELIVDGLREPVDTFDAACASGALDIPEGGWTENWSEPAAEGAGPRRIIFVLDYLHLPDLRSSSAIDPPTPTPGFRPLPGAGSSMGTNQRAPFATIRQLARALRALPPSNEEIMIAVLDGGLRVEQPFTASRERALETLDRMEKDVTLYAGHFGHPSEDPLFSGLGALVDLVDTIPGPKAAVIFTGGRGPGNEYDRQYRALADHASLARVAFYPVDCTGLEWARQFQ